MADHSYEDVMTALRNADAAGDHDAATRLATIANDMKSSKPKKESSFMDKAKGVGEAAMSMASSIPAQVQGGLAALNDIATNGKYGTQEGVQSAQKAYKEMADSHTYQPRTEEGKRYLEKAGNALEPLQAIAPHEAILMGAARPPTGSMPVRAAVSPITEKITDAVPQSLKESVGIVAKSPQKAFSAVMGDAPQEAESAMAMQRRQRGADLPVPIQYTKGQAERTPVQLNREQHIATTEAGKEIEKMYVEQNQKIGENLDFLGKRLGVKEKTPEKSGAVLSAQIEKGKPGSGGALVRKADDAYKNVSKLYKKAERVGDMQEPVSIYPLLDHLLNHDNPAEVSYVANRLKSLQAVTTDQLGQLAPTRDLTLGELEGIRRAAGAQMKNGGSVSHYAGDVQKVIDKMTEGKGGDAYREARAARAQYAKEYEIPKIVSPLLEKNRAGEPAIALEDVHKKVVMNSSVAQLRDMRDKLLNTSDVSIRKSGRKAWRELGSQTVDYIKEQTQKSVAKDSAGNLESSAVGLKRALDNIGDEKLDVLYGKGAAKEFRNLADAASDLKTNPGARVKGSPTASYLLQGIEKIGNLTSKAPMVGPITKGAFIYGKKLYEEGTAAKEIKTILAQPKIQKKSVLPQKPLSDAAAP